MNFTPKIVYNELYTGLQKTISFDSPPEKEWNEEIKGIYKETKSSSGYYQRHFNYNEQTYDLNFRFQSNATMVALDDFMQNHAMRGGEFKYYIHSDETDYETFRLESGSYKKERPIFENPTLGTFEYHVKFNIIRTLDFTLEVEGADVGVGAIAETQFTIVNNQTSPADITGLLFDKDVVRAGFVTYTVYRKTTGAGATELREAGEMTVIYGDTAGTWELTKQSNGDAGLTITVTNGGQFQYTSSNITGTEDISVMKFRASTIGVEA